MSTEITWLHEYAENARTAARQVLQWRLDRLRLYVGLVEVVDIRSDDYAADPERPVRLVPSHRDEYGQNWCVFVRDVEPGKGNRDVDV